MSRRLSVATRLVVSAWSAVLLLTACDDGDEPPVAPTQQATTSSAARDPDAYAAELFTLTNEARVAHGQAPLSESSCARTAALERAAALVDDEELEHASLAPVIRACEPLTTAAENLVNSSAGAAEVVDAWLDSAGHRANMLDPELTELGIGCVHDDDTLLCSQVFLGP